MTQPVQPSPKRLVEGGDGTPSSARVGQLLQGVRIEEPTSRDRERVWETIRARSSRAPERPWLWAAIPAAVMAVVLVLTYRPAEVVKVRPVALASLAPMTFTLVSGSVRAGALPIAAGTEIASGTKVHTEAGASAQLRFFDGSGLLLRESTEVGVAQRPGGVEIELGAGSVVATALPLAPGHRFQIVAKGFRIEVAGPAIELTSNDALMVKVSEGVAAIRTRTDGEQRVGAGQCWSSLTGRVGTCAEPVEEKPALPPPSAPRPRTTTPHVAPTPDPEPEPIAIAPVPSPEPPVAPGSAERYAEALRWVRAHEYQRAGEAFAALAEGTDRYSELSLYDLGRLRHANLRDPTGALAAFEAYRARFPNGALRHEVDLSAVEAALALGDSRRALTEASDYLTVHPLAERRALVRRIRGDLERAAGDWAAALADYQAILDQSPEPAEADDAAWGAAFCEAQVGHATAARERLESYLVRFPKGRHTAEAAQALESPKK